MFRNAISHARLMRESADRVQTALRSEDGRERLIARRVLETPAVWQQWETEHSSLMRLIAGYGVRQTQLVALKQATFRLLHGKALFQYLRDGGVLGPARVQVLGHFRPGRKYENALVSEHTHYLRKACSFLCVNHVGSDVARDEAFLDPMQRYETLYTEYFGLYCKTLVGAREDWAPQCALIPLLKHQLNEYRRAILDPPRLDPPRAQPFIRREAELRRATGDTQRLPSLKGRH